MITQKIAPLFLVASFIFISPTAMADANNCSTVTDGSACSYSGVCNTNTGICHCDDGYITTNNIDQCNYKQKKQLAAFLLQVFLGYAGAGEFYADNNGMGGGQIALLLGSPTLLAIGRCYKDKAAGTTAIVVGAVGLLGVVGWWIADMVRFGKNNVKDGNGQPLKEW